MLGLIAIALIASLIGGSNGAGIHYPCSTSSECKVPNSRCQFLSPTCGRGTCTCSDGYKDLSSGLCAKKVSYGQSCTVQDYCDTFAAVCTNGICACPIGTKPGPGGNTTFCSLEMSTRAHGEKCSSSSECFGFSNVECNKDNVCACKRGYTSADKYFCYPNTFEGDCQEDVDCQFMPMQKCKHGKCACVSGSSAHLVTIPVEGDIYRIKACLAANTMPLGEGKSCTLDFGDMQNMLSTSSASTTSSADYNEGGRPRVDYVEGGKPTTAATHNDGQAATMSPLLDSFRVCGSTLNCVECTSGIGICGYPQPTTAYSGVDRVIASSAVLFLLAFTGIRAL